MILRIVLVVCGLSTGLLIAWLLSAPTRPSRTSLPRVAIPKQSGPDSSSSLKASSSRSVGPGGVSSNSSNSSGVGLPNKPEGIQPGYTAARAYELLRGNIQEIYAAEERSEPWATERGTAIVDYTKQDIQNVDPRSKVEIDCRTSSCRIRIYSEDLRLVDAMGDYPFACMARYGTADLMQGAPGARYADFYLLFGDQNQEPAAFLENRDITCPQYRDKWLSFVKQPLDD